MKQRINNFGKYFCSDKGETLVETIIAMIIFVVCMLAVSTMLQTSLRITSSATRNANRVQEKVNAAVLSGFDSGRSVNITFYDLSGISATHSTTVSENEGIIAFMPEEGK